MITARKTGPAADDWVSLKQAARFLGEARQTVLTRVVKGEITAQHIAGRTLILRADIERILAAR